MVQGLVDTRGGGGGVLHCKWYALLHDTCVEAWVCTCASYCRWELIIMTLGDSVVCNVCVRML